MLILEGVKSLGRQAILDGADKEPIASGFAVYRATVDVGKIKKDPDVSWILQKPSLNIWWVQ